MPAASAVPAEEAPQLGDFSETSPLGRRKVPRIAALVPHPPHEHLCVGLEGGIS